MSGRSLAYRAGERRLKYLNLSSPRHGADVCVVGAGIAGITTAYLLARKRKTIVVLDSGPIGGGESGRTTAHRSNAIDDRLLSG